jgi:RNA polymerase sigma factor (sigma-70 family)
MESELDTPFLLGSRPALLRVCLRWTRGDVLEAEDLLSDAYLRALEARRTSSFAIKSPLGWWTTIIGNLGRDRLRRSRRRPVADLSTEAFGELPDQAPSLDEVVSAREQLETTLEAIDRLSETQRLAVVYRGAGQDYPGIARCLGTSVVNARKMVQTARDTLRGH